jgi:hypothetical protein
MFARALGNDSDDLVKALEAYLLDRGWPDDYQFQTAFVEFPLYQRGYTREVLETLERTRGHKEPADLQAAQVEHVLPQTLNDAWISSLGSEAERIQTDWLHRPGNLTLSAYNQELWNHPFKTKRERYAESNIVITRELAAYDRWGEEEIRARGHQLAQEGASIWIGPKEQIARADVDGGAGDDAHGWRELRPRFWRGLNDYLVAEHPDLPDFEPRLSPTIRLPSGLRHIGFELRLGLRQQNAGIDVWFWRAASLPVWERIRQLTKEYQDLVGASWEFEKVEGRNPRARMSINVAAEVHHESSWPEVYRWLGEKLSLVYERLAPKLREEMDRGSVG